MHDYATVRDSNFTSQLQISSPNLWLTVVDDSYVSAFWLARLEGHCKFLPNGVVRVWKRHSIYVCMYHIIAHARLLYQRVLILRCHALNHKQSTHECKKSGSFVITSYVRVVTEQTSNEPANHRRALSWYYVYFAWSLFSTHSNVLRDDRACSPAMLFAYARLWMVWTRTLDFRGLRVWRVQ